MALTKVSGSILKDPLNLGEVSIGGTLTYEDVTNVDSLGIGTFRTGINVSGGQLDVGSNIKLGNAGVITATSFVGDGSGLTGAGPSLTNGANDRIITATGANALQGEANLTFDGQTLTISAPTNDTPLIVNTGSSNGSHLRFQKDGANKHFIGSGGGIGLGDIDDLSLRTVDNIIFGVGTSEKVRITNSGQLFIGTTSGSELLCLKRNDATGPTITIENNANKTYINNWGATGGGSGRTNRFEINATLASQASYCAQYHTFMTGNAGDSYEKLRITSDGDVNIGNNAGYSIWRTSANDSRCKFQFKQTTGDNRGFALLEERGDANCVDFFLSKSRGGNGVGAINSGDNLGIIKFSGGDGTRQHNGAGIQAWTSGTIATGRVPTNLSFYTAPDSASSYLERLRIHSAGTVQAFNHLTSRNGIVQIKQVTSNTRYSGSIASVDLITSSTMSPKTSAPRFLIMIFCPVNTSDDSDAANQNANYYFYGRIEYRKNGGGWIECNDQGSTANQGGYAAHIELSPPRTGNNSTDYWAGNRYRMEHKQATILATNVGDCGSGGTVEFKLRGYSHSGSFVHIGQPHGHGTDDDYAVQPWGFTVFELAPDSNSYTAY